MEPICDQPLRRPRRHSSRGRRRWPWFLLAAALLVGGPIALMAARWGEAIKARFHSRLEQTVRDLPGESASIALPPVCFLLALAIAVLLAVIVYRMERGKGFIFAGIFASIAFLMWIWAMAHSSAPLSTMDLRHVQIDDFLTALSHFTVVLVPVGAYGAWLLPKLK